MRREKQMERERERERERPELESTKPNQKEETFGQRSNNKIEKCVRNIK